MVCLYCGGNTRVANSRLQKRQNTTWRRRLCDVCKNSFTTREQPVLPTSVLVQKKSKKRPEAFNRDHLFLSLFEACKHRPRALTECAALTETVTAVVLKTIHDGAIDRDAIVAIAHETLANFDTTAAALYTAYHPENS